MLAARSADAAGRVSARHTARRRVERHLNACLRRGESRPQGVSFREEVSWVGERLLAENERRARAPEGSFGGLLRLERESTGTSALKRDYRSPPTYCYGVRLGRNALLT